MKNGPAEISTGP